MPAAMTYTPDDVALQKAAAAELLDRRTMIDEALRYYEGKHREYLKTDDGINDNVRRNLWKEAKDREVSFLFPKMVGLSLDQDELDDTSDEKWLLDAWEENGGAELLNELALWGALAGHVFARVMEPKPGEEYPCIYALDPSNVLVFWKADNKREVLWYSIYWASGKTEYRQDLVENERTEGWMIYQYSRERNDNTQTESTWGRTTATPWGYPSPPIVDWPHIRRPREYYGSNEGELILTWSRLQAPSGYTWNELGVLPNVCTSKVADADRLGVASLDSSQGTLMRWHALRNPTHAGHGTESRRLAVRFDRDRASPR